MLKKLTARGKCGSRQSKKPCRWNSGLTHRTFQSGQGITEYLAVLAGLAIVWVSVQVVISFINRHNENYSEALKLVF